MAALVAGPGLCATACGLLSATHPLHLVVAALLALTAGGWAFWRVSRWSGSMSAHLERIAIALESYPGDRVAETLAPGGPTDSATRAAIVLLERCAAADARKEAHRVSTQTADKERLAFLADFSHELRTPLNAILGFSHILENETDGPLDEDGREAVQVIRTSGEHLRTLVEDILDLTSLLSGELRLSPEPVDVLDVAREIAKVIAPYGPHVECIGTPGKTILVDAARLRRIVWNLVARAVRISPDGPVQVRVESTAEMVTIGISDTGRPIDPAELTALGGDAELETTLVKGSGVGLAVAGRLVRRMGGSATASALEKGTCVSVRLAAPPDDEQATR